MIDWDRVSDLLDDVGADEFEPVLELFIDEVEHLVMQLTKDDAGLLERYMHFLKGSAWNLGFAEFGATCQQVETLAAKRDLDNVSIGAIVECYSNSKKLFMRDLARMTGAQGRDGVEVA